MSISLSFSNMLGSVVLLCAFLQISTQRMTMIRLLCQIQAFILAGGAVWQAILEHEWSPYGVGLLVLVLQGVGLPWAMRGMVRVYKTGQTLKTKLPLPLALLLGLLPVGLGVMSFLHGAAATTSPSTQPLASQAVMISVSVVLLGLWLMIIQKQKLAQISGFVVLADGLILALENIVGLGVKSVVAVMVLLGLAAGLLGLAYLEQQAVVLVSGIDGAEP